jgi:NitT/TauT family transport system substrate-binding protein
MRPHPRLRPIGPVLALVAALGLASCGVGGSPSPSATTPLTVGLGFIPSVQFAQFYLAQQAGYYAEEGLTVTFQNKIDPDLVALVGQGTLDLGMSDGTSVIPAVSQGIPIRYLATVYGRFPSIVFGKASSGIETAADLEGQKIGIPGRFGSSWIMLQALLGSADLTPDDVEIVEYPDFGQGAAVTQGAVDAATGFANNEPVVLERSGTPVFVLHVDDITALPGPGLIASTATIDAKREAVAGFVRATLRAMKDIVAEPAKGLDATIHAVPELGQDRELQAAILEATIDAWQAPGAASLDSLGGIDRDGWEASVAFMTGLGLVPNPVTLDQLVVEDFVTAP